MISFADFSSQLLFSLFEVAAAAVILLFGWYFARVIAWYAAGYFGASGFYSSLKDLRLPRVGSIGKFDLPRWIELIARGWIVLVFAAVSLAIVGFGPASRFLGKVLEDSVRALLAIFILALAALASDNLPKIIGWRFLRRLRDPLLLARAARIAVWFLALLAVAFIAKIIPLRKAIGWGGAVVALAFLAELAIGFGLAERLKNPAAKLIKRLRKN